MLSTLQQVFLFVFAFINLLLFFKSLHEVKDKKNAFGLTMPLFVIGAFVWGDAVIFSLFWILVAAVTLIVSNWYLFLLFLAVFWLVRSLGETIYWFLQQFSTLNRNPPENLPGYRFFHNDSIWFIYQIIWQCVSVISLIASIYLAHLWLASL